MRYEALLAGVKLRLETARQSRCQVALDGLEALEATAKSSITSQIRSELSSLLLAKERIQMRIDAAKRAHDRGARLKRHMMNDKMCRHFESVLRMGWSSRCEVDIHGKIAEWANHIRLQNTVAGYVDTLKVGRTRYLDKFAACKKTDSGSAQPFYCFIEAAILLNVRAHRDQAYVIMQKDVGKITWHDVASHAVAWKLEQRAKHDMWLKDATTMLRGDSYAEILELHNEAAAVREAVGNLKAILADQSISSITVDETFVLIDALARGLYIGPRAQVNLYLDILFNTNLDEGAFSAANSLLFDLQCQVRANKCPAGLS